MPKRFKQSAVVVLLIGLGQIPALRAARGDSWHMTVRGGETDMGETPVVVELKEPMPVGLYAAVSPSRWHCRQTESRRAASSFAGFSTGALPFVRRCSVASPWQDAQPFPPCANGAAAK